MPEYETLGRIFEHLEHPVELGGIGGQLAAQLVELGNQRRCTSRGGLAERRIQLLAHRLQPRNQAARLGKKGSGLPGSLFRMHQCRTQQTDVFRREQLV